MHRQCRFAFLRFDGDRLLSVCMAGRARAMDVSRKTTFDPVFGDFDCNDNTPIMQPQSQVGAATMFPFINAFLAFIIH